MVVPGATSLPAIWDSYHIPIPRTDLSEYLGMCVPKGSFCDVAQRISGRSIKRTRIVSSNIELTTH